MAMSDCEKCWNTPCTCGWDYIDWSRTALRKQILLLKAILFCRVAHMGDSKEEIFKQVQKLVQEGETAGGLVIPPIKEGSEWIGEGEE